MAARIQLSPVVVFVARLFKDIFIFLNILFFLLLMFINRLVDLFRKKGKRVDISLPYYSFLLKNLITPFVAHRSCVTLDNTSHVAVDILVKNIEVSVS